MFTLEQPSMALNDTVGVPHSQIRMWNTWSVPQSDSRQHIIGWVKEVARGAPGGKLKNVVINCHGLPGSVLIGEGFSRSHTALFRDWAGFVDKIWFVACLVARIPTPAMQADLDARYHAYNPSDGNIFCSEIARHAQAYVVAPTEEQRNRGGYGIGQMPTFEGLLLSYGPRGDVTWSHRYSSDWRDNQE
jgi:hypothetical protein